MHLLLIPINFTYKVDLLFRELKLRIEKKRQSLRDWMKKKRIERNEKYLMEVEEKRQKESRPFAGKAKVRQLIVDLYTLNEENKV